MTVSFREIAPSTSGDTLKHPEKPRGRGRGGTIALAGVLLLAVCSASCSSPPKKEYETPDALCGVSVDPGLVAPFLPAGKKISMHPDNSIQGWMLCDVGVDGTRVLSANTKWEEGSLREVAGDPLNGVDVNSTTTPDKRYTYTRLGGIGLVDCQDPKRPEQQLVASVRVMKKSGSEAEMKKLITAFTEGVAGSAECARRRLK
ncbi:hypothetical protein OG349_09525 [Streptomyces sp. NBC_01317]|uniref:hypothetical protein n=1 Tax=Streptomyces sp. NBC_01317 TaxID=2903822 RepID=UPI002E10366D|nr:hypothetical protein OG349_09525 [Streptomyces sp. NBC_01317]